MHDRVPANPGRVKITPENGGAAYYATMERADNPRQEGTPLSKETLLKDATAALFGLGADAVPDDVFNVLSPAVLVKKLPRYTKKTASNPAYGKAVGDTVSLNVNGVATDFIVVHIGNPDPSIYDESCNGIWLMAHRLSAKMAFGATSYSDSNVHKYLVGEYYESINNETKPLIKSVKIPVKGGGSNGVSAILGDGLSAKVFSLSYTELAYGSNGDGYPLAYFDGASNSVKTATYIQNGVGTLTSWWTRSISSSNINYAGAVGTGGEYSNMVNSQTYGVRPTMVLHNEAEVEYYGDDEGNIYTEQEYDTLLANALDEVVDIPASQIVGGVNIAAGMYTGTGTSGASNPTMLSLGFVPRLLFVSFSYGDEGKVGVAKYSASGLTNSSNDVHNLIFQFNEFSTAVQEMYIASNVSIKVYSSADGKTLYWYSDASQYAAWQQLNYTGYHYYYFAIG